MSGTLGRLALNSWHCGCRAFLHKTPKRYIPRGGVTCRPSENDAATSGKVALLHYTTMALSRMISDAAPQAKRFVHNASCGQSVGPLARLVTQSLSHCHHDT
jgi:hypothetical protein